MIRLNFNSVSQHVLLVLALVVPATASHAVQMSSAELLAEAHELAVSDPRVVDVGWVSGFRDGSWYTFGSGVALDDGGNPNTTSWVGLTTHQIVNSQNYTGFRFSLGPGVYSPPEDRVLADAWYSHPGYANDNAGGTGFDFSLIHLERPINSGGATIYTGAITTGTRILGAGYGTPTVYPEPEGAFDGLKREFENFADRLQIFVQPQYMLLRYGSGTGGPSLPREGLGTSHDSGGGIFVEIGGETQLAALIVGGNESSNIATRLAAVQDFMNQVMMVPEPGDFDEDGDVDGRDFLTWQRNPAVGDLVDWQNNYNSGGELTVAVSVPEAGTATMALLSAVDLLILRRRRLIESSLLNL